MAQARDEYSSSTKSKGRNYGASNAVLPKPKVNQNTNKGRSYGGSQSAYNPILPQLPGSKVAAKLANSMTNGAGNAVRQAGSIRLPELPGHAQAAGLINSALNRPVTIQDMNPDYHTTPFSFYGSGRPMGAGMNLTPEDYLALPDAMYNQAAMAARANSRMIDTRFPMGINSPEEAVSDLPDNYPWLFPEVTGEETGADTSGDTGYGGGYPETPYDYLYPEWGGGGYNKYFRDNGLINWRI